MSETNAFSIVEWTLFLEGPLPRAWLIAAAESHPYWSNASGHLPVMEVQVRQATAALAAKGAIRFDPSRNVWESVTEPSSPLPETMAVTEHRSPLVLGNGSETVYSLFNPLTRYRIALSGGSHWPMKIGRTSRQVTARLREFRTSARNPLEVGILFKTSDSVMLERYFHQELTGRRLRESGAGHEWYWSNFKDLESLYEHLCTIDELADAK